LDRKVIHDPVNAINDGLSLPATSQSHVDSRLLVQGAPQLFIGDIEVALRRLQIRVTEQKLDCP